MAIIQNPETGQYEWDYNDGPIPNDVPPWNPETGQPWTQDMLPPGVTGWDSNAGTWQAGGAPSDTAVTGPMVQPPGDGSDTGKDWFDTNAPAGPNYPQPFGETYSAPPRPAWLQGEYKPPAWQGGDFAAPQKPPSLVSEFQAPTQAELESSPGYGARMSAAQKAFEHSAAAKGSILSGGSQVALGREQQQLASNEYGNLFQQRLQGRQQTAGEYQTDFGNAFDSYKQRYGQFLDAANLGFGARQLNETAYGNDVNASQNQFNTRYQGYQDVLANNRTAQNDWWNEQQDLFTNGLNAANATRPPA